ERHGGAASGVPVVPGAVLEDGPAEAHGRGLAAEVLASVKAEVDAAVAVAAPVVVLADQDVLRIRRVHRDRGLVLRLGAAEVSGRALAGALLVGPDIRERAVRTADGMRRWRHRGWLEQVD